MSAVRFDGQCRPAAERDVILVVFRVGKPRPLIHNFAMEITMRAEHVLAKDIEAFASMEPVLQHYYPRKFVVFHDGRLQGSFDTFHNAASDAVRRFRNMPFLIRQVGATD